MSAQVIDGNAIAREVRAEWKLRADRLNASRARPPGLAVIMVGDNPASRVYVRNKLRASAEMGIRSRAVPLSGRRARGGRSWTRIQALNADPACHGILVQLPLPPQVSVRQRAGDDLPRQGRRRLPSLQRRAAWSPAAPSSRRARPTAWSACSSARGIPIAGQNVTVVGASNIVGKPLGLMFLQREATVAICHVKTRDLAQFTIAADILVVAAGKPNLVTAPMVRTGAVVIDVGINRLPDGRLIGDVDFEAVRHKTSYITPVPGGVGPDDGDDAPLQHHRLGRAPHPG